MTTETVEISKVIKSNPKQGDYAWVIMALGILAYDMFAMKSKKVETMSSAMWRSLSHPIKAPLAGVCWAILTHHLFANKRARASYSIYLTRKVKTNAE